jgi:hypothetical protein
LTEGSFKAGSHVVVAGENLLHLDVLVLLGKTASPLGSDTTTHIHTHVHIKRVGYRPIT